MMIVGNRTPRVLRWFSPFLFPCRAASKCLFWERFSRTLWLLYLFPYQLLFEKLNFFILWFEHQFAVKMTRRGYGRGHCRPLGQPVWTSGACATHQAAQDGQEDGDGGRVAHKLCDNGHQDARQQGDGPRRQAAQGQHLVPDPGGEARALQAGGRNSEKKGGKARSQWDSESQQLGGVGGREEPRESECLPISWRTQPSGMLDFCDEIIFLAQKIVFL